MSNVLQVHANLSVCELMEEAVRRGEGKLASNGALAVYTGKFTGRSPADRFIVDDTLTHDQVDWGKTNQAFDSDRFAQLFQRVQTYMAGTDTFVFNGFIGADSAYRLPIRVVTEQAWHSLFAHQLLLRPAENELETHIPEFTVIDASRFLADPIRDGTRSETFILLDFTRKIALIGGTEYAGEIKKSIFSALNFLLPQVNVFPMHCSSNIGKNGDVALFFGLSGTGKTTLSAVPERRLIGDDEHGWSGQGVFNFEGGCYAKCIHLTERGEPEIWKSIRFGTVLENVVLRERTRIPNYDDSSITENTRAAYPLDYIPHAVHPSIGGTPKTVLFLTADAFGVLPPVAALSREQAMYHFLSGYTSKLGGTERGITTPEATFSTCFGAPFMPLSPMRYAQMLGDRLLETGTRCWLVNTGWTGGPYGIGSRMDLELTRKMVNAVLSGALNDVPTTTDPIFNLRVPNVCPGIPPEVLKPRSLWHNSNDYDVSAKTLASLFIHNFRRFEPGGGSLTASGPTQ